MKALLVFILVLFVGCTAPKNDQTQAAKTPVEQPSQEHRVTEGKKIGPLTQKQWAEDWNIWYDTMLGSPPAIHIVKRFEGAESYQLVKGQVAAEVGTALSLSVVEANDVGNELGVLRFTEEVDGEYDTVFIHLPDGDLLIYSKIERTE